LIDRGEILAATDLGSARFAIGVGVDGNLVSADLYSYREVERARSCP
jgi:hypothetical protein